MTAPLVITQNEDGSDLYLYEGAAVPSHIKGEELARLVDGGFLSEPGPQFPSPGWDADDDEA